MPNPSQGVFNITIGNWTENVEAEVFNLLGQAVLVKHSFRYNTKLNLSTQTNGLYIVKLSSDGYAGTFKIVKE